MKTIFMVLALLLSPMVLAQFSIEQKNMCKQVGGLLANTKKLSDICVFANGSVVDAWHFVAKDTQQKPCVWVHFPKKDEFQCKLPEFPIEYCAYPINMMQQRYVSPDIDYVQCEFRAYQSIAPIDTDALWPVDVLRVELQVEPRVSRATYEHMIKIEDYRQSCLQQLRIDHHEK